MAVPSLSLGSLSAGDILFRLLISSRSFLVLVFCVWVLLVLFILVVWLASTPLIVTMIVMISLSVVSMILTLLFQLFCAATYAF